MAQKRDFKQIPLNVKITCIESWTHSGLVRSTYERDISGLFEKITPYHYYGSSSGRDIYVTQGQLDRLLAGEEVTLGLNQWI